MKYGKLKAIVKKEKRFNRLVIILGGAIALFLVIGILSNIAGQVPTTAIMSILMVLALIIVILICIFSSKADKYGSTVYDYICVRVMDIVVESGIETSNFEMIDEANTGILYIGFHNQKVDYDELRSKLNTELDEMNKISGRNVRVKLI